MRNNQIRKPRASFYAEYIAGVRNNPKKGKSPIVSERKAIGLAKLVFKYLPKSGCLFQLPTTLSLLPYEISKSKYITCGRNGNKVFL